MKKLFLYALLVIIVLAGCKKNRDEVSEPAPTPTPVQTPTVTTGKLIGEISSASNYVITKIVGPNATYYARSYENAGVFSLQGLVPGAYVISFKQAPPYYFRPDTTLQLGAGQTINLGTLVPSGGGIFKGTINPVGSLVYMRAHNTQATTTDPDAIIPLSASAGAFATSQLQPGTYRISFLAASGYKPPASPVTLTVGAGEVVDLGAVTARPNLLTGLPFNGGGATQDYASPILTITSAGSNGGNSIPGIGGGPTTSFTLTMDDVIGVGTYPCRGTTTSAMTYKVSGFGGGIWSTNNPGGSGTVVVTSIDPVKKEIKGTFTAILVSNIAGRANVVINNGSFYFAY